jgi:hypothetical protein
MAKRYETCGLTCKLKGTSSHIFTYCLRIYSDNVNIIDHKKRSLITHSNTNILQEEEYENIRKQDEIVDKEMRMKRKKIRKSGTIHPHHPEMMVILELRNFLSHDNIFQIKSHK